MVRRHVLGMSDDASVWARFGQRLGRAALWAARLLVDFRATRAGIRQAILAATPLPELDERAAEREDLDVTAILREDLAVGLERIRRAAEADLASLAGRLEDLSAVVGQVGQLGREGQHRLAERLEPPGAGRRGQRLPVQEGPLSRALPRARGVRRPRGRRPGGRELAARAGLQAGTARAYVYQELAELAGNSEEAGIHRQAGAVMASGRSEEGK